MILDRRLISVSSVAQSQDVLDRAQRERMKEQILEQLSGCNYRTVVELDFHFVRYIDAQCGDAIVQVIRRLMIGEYPERFIILRDLQRQHRGNIHLPFDLAKLAVISVDDDRWSFLGKLMPSYAAALDRVMVKGDTTARELKNFMKYKTVNEASTKLSGLYYRRLVTREEATGRAFRYISLGRSA